MRSQKEILESQFLSDVITAAGLLRYGKQSKALAARIGSYAFAKMGGGTKKSTEFFAGQEISTDYPFLRTTYSDFSDGEVVELKTWRPGVNFESDGFDGTDTCADANGKVVYTVVELFKPGRFPERVFFTRNWIDPDGKQFGKSKLHITTKQNFRNLTKGYRHDYEFYEE